MKISLPVHAALWTHPWKQGDYVLLKASCRKDHDLLLRFFRAKTEREKRNQKKFFVQAVLDLPCQKRTFKQNAAVWVLVTAVFESMEGRLPDEEEKYSLYLDLLEEYADKVQNRFGGLRPVHISESNSAEGARFIDGLLYHLAVMCDLSIDAQSTVAEVMREWEAWRGGMETDPADYADPACARLLTEEEWREKRPVSEASGRGGEIVRAHIVSRGADAADAGKSWNWAALLPEEHELQHRIGWDGFLRIYPHLRGRVERARRLAGKLGPGRYSGENLAAEALEDGE